MATKRVQVKLEFLFRASPTIVYTFLTSPAYLVRWFCQSVDIMGTQYTFGWDGSEQVAELIEDIEDELLRFEWEDAPSSREYLEFRITESDVTSETILTITDYCDADEVDDIRKIWENQIKTLRIESGSL